MRKSIANKEKKKKKKKRRNKKAWESAQQESCDWRLFERRGFDTVKVLREATRAMEEAHLILLLLPKVQTKSNKKWAKPNNLERKTKKKKFFFFYLFNKYKTKKRNKSKKSIAVKT